MLRALPVLATNWSGNIDFLTPENGLPISYSLVPAVDPPGNVSPPSLMWAEVNTQEAATKLRMLRDDADLGAALGRQAASDAAAMFSAEAYHVIVRDATVCLLAVAKSRAQIDNSPAHRWLCS